MKSTGINNAFFNTDRLQLFEQSLRAGERAEATVRKYITDVRTFATYLYERTGAGCGRVDKDLLLSYKKWLKENYAVSSANSMLAALNQYLDYLGAPELKVKPYRMQRSLFLQEEKELTRNEFTRLVRAADRDGKEWLALCMETIAATGIRISELSAFTVDAVKRGRIEIYNKGKYRRIFLPSKIRQKLTAYCRRHRIRVGVIFRNRRGEALDRSRIWREMKSLKDRTGIDPAKIFPHNLRHLFARVYYQCTRDLFGLADLLGHSNVNVTRIYTQNTGKIYQKQLDKMQILRI